jgi:hypothetical protein
MSVRIFGQHDEATVAQIHRCMAVGGTRAVLCADGHKGYAQPIGGVIAYRDLVSIWSRHLRSVQGLIITRLSIWRAGL